MDRYNLYQRIKNKTEILVGKLITNKVLEKHGYIRQLTLSQSCY